MESMKFERTPTPYVLVAHIAAGEEYCRGCIVDGWSGELEVGQYETFEATLARCKDLITQELEKEGDRRGGWDLNVYHPTEDERFYPDHNRRDDDFADVLRLHYVAERNRIEDRKASEAAQRVRDEQERRRQADLKKLAELKAQYGE